VDQQLRLDLAQLDAEAAQLDLVVVAAEEVQGAVRQVPAQVAGLVYPGVGFRCKRIRQEAFLGQCIPVQITARNTGTSDIQFGLYPLRHRFPVSVQQVDANIRHRPSDDPAIRHLRFVKRGIDRGLGRSVSVDEPRLVTLMFEPAPERHAAHLFAAHDHLAQAGRNTRQVFLNQLFPVSRRQVDPGNLMFAAKRPEGRRAADPRDGAQDQSRTAAQRAENLLDRDVEIHRGELQHPFLRPERAVPAECRDLVA
jgi:hypothetical protein